MGCLALTADFPGASFRSDVTYSVRVGSPWIDQLAQTTIDLPVHQVIVNSRFRAHRLWSWVGRANNIALLRLKGEFKYSKYVWPICLPGIDYVVKDGTLCTVMGWGLPQVNGELEPPQTRLGGGGEDLGTGWGLPWTHRPQELHAPTSFPSRVSAVSTPWPLRP